MSPRPRLYSLRFLLVFAAALALTLGLASCGDESGSTSNTDQCTGAECATDTAGSDTPVDLTPADTASADTAPTDTASADTAPDTAADTQSSDVTDTAADTSQPDTASDTDDDAPCESGIICLSICCATTERCAYDACTLDLGPCATHDECSGDSYCDTDGRCTPYGVPSDMILDEECARPLEVGAFAPEEQCRWSGAPAGDPTAADKAIYSAPMVVDFDFDNDPNVLAPSIVVTTYHSPTDEGGLLRIFDGRTCAEQFRFTGAGDRLLYASNNALGDIDLDGRPDIVSTSLSSKGVAGGVVAFGYNDTTQAFERLWYGRRCDLSGEPRHMPNKWPNNNGPSIHDLDDDGSPEILLERFVYDSNGCLLNPTQTTTNYLGLGTFATVADMDMDGNPELAGPDGVYNWDRTTKDWVMESNWAPPAADAAETSLIGLVAVANLVGSSSSDAEMVVVSAPATNSSNTATGRVRVVNTHGEIVFGPFPLPNDAGQVAGRGGAPTIADFDGDGRPEFAVAGASRYTVFDLDCDIDGETGPGCDRVAGLPRGVLWSQPSRDFSSNVTGSSVFDFDGDGVAEVVYGDECFVRIYRGTDGEVLFSSSASSGTGYEYPVIADVDGDFNSEIVVAMTNMTTCPATDPIFTAGTATFQASTGFVVLRDEQDRWAASRPIWNQHAYSVTNVNDDGTIPRTRDWMPNHSDPSLNSFRQNAQGALGTLGLADLTVTLARLEELCLAEGGEVELGARVCNRGTNPVPDGARVVFYEGDPEGGAAQACETTLPTLLHPGDCTEVTCPWTIPSGQSISEVTVVVDPDQAVSECRDGNNRGAVAALLCTDIN